MKFTKRQLKKIIQEELEHMLEGAERLPIVRDVRKNQGYINALARAAKGGNIEAAKELRKEFPYAKSMQRVDAPGKSDFSKKVLSKHRSKDYTPQHGYDTDLISADPADEGTVSLPPREQQPQDKPYGLRMDKRRPSLQQRLKSVKLSAPPAEVRTFKELEEIVRKTLQKIFR